jgi:hypothetical protein
MTQILKSVVSPSSRILFFLLGFLFCSSAPSFAAATASLMGTDATTRGNWMSTYGTVGYYIPGGPAQTPSDGSTFNPGAASLWTWGKNVTSPGALKTSASMDIASAWYADLGTASPSLTLDVNVSSGSQTVALYLLDYDQKGRAESVSVTDPNNGNAPLGIPIAVSGTNFANGEYLIWQVTGEIHINITLVTGPNAVASGIFFGENSNMPPPATSSVYHTQFGEIAETEEGPPFYAAISPIKLTLPAGNYLLRATGNFQELTGAPFVKVACAFYQGSVDATNIISSTTQLYIPAIFEGTIFQAAGTTDQEIPLTIATTTTIFWSCADSSGGGSSIGAIISLTAMPFSSINIQ